MNLSDPDDLRCTLSCAISVPQSLCPRACAPQLASVIHVSVQNITENACCTSASSGTAFSSVKILLKVYRGEVPMSPNTTPGVATVGHCRYFWFPMFPKQQEQPNSGLIPGVSCFRMLQNASECFRMLHSCGCCGKYLTNLLDLVSFSHCLTNRGWRWMLQNASVSPTKPASPVAPRTKGRNVVWCAPARRSCSGRELVWTASSGDMARTTYSWTELIGVGDFFGGKCQEIRFRWCRYNAN